MDDFSPEEMREFNENLNTMNSTMGPLANALSTLASDLKTLSNETKKSSEQQEENRKRDQDSQNQRGKSNKSSEDAIDTHAKKMAAALNVSTAALGKFSGALISGIDGLGKYGQAITGFGESAKQTGEALGGFSKYVGRAVNMLSQFLDTALKQADAQNQFIKDMNNLGGIVDTTTQGLADAAREAGASARDLEGLSIILQGASKSLTAFGAGTSDGLKKTLEVMKLSDQQEREMRRYSFTLQEAQAEQAYYIELQRTAGTNLNISNLSATKVREDSLRYAKNLRELSELTGMQSAQIKDEQSAAQADMRNKLRNAADDNAIGRLNKQIANEENEERKAQLTAQRDQLKQEKETRQQSINEFAGLLGADMAAKLGNVIGTGAFDENTRELSVIFGRAGVGAGDLQKRFKGLQVGSDEYEKAMADTIGEFAGGVRKNVDDFGKSMENAANASEIGSAVGLTDATLNSITQLGLESEAREKMLTVEEKVRKSTDTQIDAQKDLVASLQVLETNVRTEADEFINAMNPFTGALGLGTLAVGGFTAQLGLAIIQLKGMGAGGMLSSLTPTGPFTKGGAMKQGVGNLFKGVIGKVALPLAAAGAAFKAYSDTQAKNDLADKEYDSATAGQDAGTDQGAKSLYEAEMALNAQTTRNNKVGISQAAGGVGGVVAGAAAGAAIGSVVPIIGTAIGGLIGAGLGAWMGSELGEAVGMGLTDVQMEALEEKSDEELALMPKDEAEAWKKAHADAVTALQQAEDAEETRKEQAAQAIKDANTGLKEAKADGLYVHHGMMMDSEVNLTKLKEQRDAAEGDAALQKILADKLQGILNHDDLSDNQQKIIEAELEKLVASSKALEEEAKGDKEDKKKTVVAEKQKDMGRTMDLSPENLAKIFEAEMKAESKQKLEEVVVAVERVIPKAVLTPDIDSKITPDIDPNQAIADADAIVAAIIESPVIKDRATVGPPKPMNEATKEFVAWHESDEGQAEIAQNEKIRAEKKAEMNTSAEDRMLANESKYREVLDTGKYKGEDASESIMGQAEAYLASIEETKSRRMATAQDMPAGLLNPEIDIEPEPIEELDEERGMSTTEFAQRKAEDSNTLSEKMDQLIAVTTQGNAINEKAKNAAVETAETNQKIMQSSIV